MSRFILAIWIVFSALSASAENELRGIYNNNGGVGKFSSDKPTDAFAGFSRALGDLPFSGEVHFNLGNGFLQARDYEKAILEYEQARKHAPGDSPREREVRFRAYFNSAVAATELKDVDRALALYQQALEVQPDSVETKTNIELLTMGGQGQGDDQDGKDGKEKDKQNKEGKNDKDRNGKMENPKYQPRQFAPGQDLSEQDVKRILEELKRQEEQIRARMQNQEAKDAPPAKDW